MARALWAAAVVAGVAMAASAMAAPGEVLHLAAPPPAHTGGFGEPTCQACHDEFDLNVEGRVLIVGLPDAPEPGTTYPLAVELHSVEMGAAGFALSARFADGPRRGEQAGLLEPMDARTAVTPGGNGVAYLHHTAEGTATPDPARVRWDFAWTAPDEAEAVVFHVAANSANGDNSPLGDLVYTASAGVPGTNQRTR
jgi:hypothetical protein